MAPRFVDRGLAGVFRSRWGIALVIAVLVLIIVGFGRFLSTDGGPGRQPIGAGSPQPALSVNPDDEDSVIAPEPPPSPSTSPGTALPEAVAYAFASAWVSHENVAPKAWRDRLVPNSTAELSDELAETNPQGVPADRVIGKPQIVPVGEGLIDAVVETDAGKLTLRLVAPDGKWLVSGIDWANA